jgi:hypothetical protein
VGLYHRRVSNSAHRGRVITLIALDGWSDTAALRALPGVDAELFGLAAPGGRHEFDPSSWRPHIVDLRTWDPVDYTAPNAGAAYRVHGVRTALVHVPLAADLLLLDLDVEADLPGLILAERDAFDPALTLQIGGQPLVEAAGATGMRPANDRHQLLFLAGVQRPLFPVGGDRGRELRQLLFKDVDITYRADYAPVSTPPDINGPDRQSVHVWATNTLVEGFDAYGELGRLRTLGLVQSNCQVLAATARCRQVRALAMRELGTGDLLGEAAEELRDLAEERIRRLGRLRHALTVGVEMHARSAAVAGGRPLLSYHAAVVSESELPALLDVTQHLLGQVSGAVAAEEELRQVQESRETAAKMLSIAESVRGLLDQSEALKSASLVFASIAVVIGLAGLFGQAAAIPRGQDDTLFGSLAASLLFVAVVVIAAAVLGFTLRAASRLTAPPGWRRGLRNLRWALLVVTAVGVGTALAVARTAGPGWGLRSAVTAAFVGIVGLLFCFAVELDFDGTPDPADPARSIEIWPVVLTAGQVLRRPEGPLRVAARIGAGRHAHDLVIAEVTAQLGRAPRYVHSTSWRAEQDALVLTYLAVVTGTAPPPGWTEVTPAVVPPDPGDPLRPPQRIRPDDVLDHALGHLAFLIEHRTTERGLFAPAERALLRGWTPRPAGEL